jgi:two-component SAPR family response regulator
VEDEFFIAEYLADGLSDAGADVIGPAYSVAHALKMIEGEAETLSAAVLDVNLSWGATSFPVADKLSIPFAFVTAYAQLLSEHAYRNVPKLDKPVSMGNLVRVLDRLVKDRLPGEAQTR